MYLEVVVGLKELARATLDFYIVIWSLTFHLIVKYLQKVGGYKSESNDKI